MSDRTERQRKYAVGELNNAVKEVGRTPLPPEFAAVVQYLHAVAAGLIYVGDAMREANQTDDAN